jgi:hypothetical protein
MVIPLLFITLQASNLTQKCQGILARQLSQQWMVVVYQFVIWSMKDSGLHYITQY